MSGTLLPAAVLQFLDSNGDPVVGGTVTYYIPNTTALGSIFADSAFTIPLQNPLPLDAGGRPQTGGSPVSVWGSGVYYMVVEDAQGNAVSAGLTSSLAPSPVSVAMTPVVSAGTVQQGFNLLAANGLTIALSMLGGFAATGNSTLAGTLTGLTGLTLASGFVTLANALTPGNGGTGKSSVTTGSLLLGNGAGNMTELAPGTSGNIAQSNGTVWTSGALTSGQVTGALGFVPAAASSEGNKRTLTVISGNITLQPTDAGVYFTLTNVNATVALPNPAATVLGGELEFWADCPANLVSLTGSLLSLANGVIGSLNLADGGATILRSIVRLVNDQSHWRIIFYLIYPSSGGPPSPGPE